MALLFFSRTFSFFPPEEDQFPLLRSWFPLVMLSSQSPMAGPSPPRRKVFTSSYEKLRRRVPLPPHLEWLSFLGENFSLPFSLLFPISPSHGSPDSREPQEGKCSPPLLQHFPPPRRSGCLFSPILYDRTRSTSNDPLFEDGRAFFLFSLPSCPSSTKQGQGMLPS